MGRTDPCVRLMIHFLDGVAMKKFGLMFVLLFLVAPAFAGTAVLSTTVGNHYMAANGNIPYNKPVMQSNLFIGLGQGFYANFWNSDSFEEWNTNSGSELDYSLGWGGKLLDSKFSASLDLSYYDLAKVGDFGAGNVFSPTVKLSRDFEYVVATLSYQRFDTSTGSSFVGGNMYGFGLSKSIAAEGAKYVSMSSYLEITYDGGVFGNSSGSLLRGNNTLNWTVFPNVVLTAPGVKYFVPVTIDDRRKSNATLFGGLKYIY